jgi:hypothetical protein
MSAVLKVERDPSMVKKRKVSEKEGRLRPSKKDAEYFHLRYLEVIGMIRRCKVLRGRRELFS